MFVSGPATRGHYTGEGCGHHTLTPNPPSPLDPILRHLLEVSIQQSQLSQEMAQGFQVVTRELLVLQQTAVAAAADSLLDPALDAQHILTKLTEDDDVEAFLEAFDSVATREDWSQTTLR